MEIFMAGVITIGDNLGALMAPVSNHLKFVKTCRACSQCKSVVESRLCFVYLRKERYDVYRKAMVSFF